MLNRFFLDASGQISADILRLSGPTVQVEFSVPSVLAEQLGAAGNPIPQPHIGEALIDTGASTTCIDRSVVAALQLQPVGQSDMSTPSGPRQPTSVFAVKVGFPQGKIPLRADGLAVLGVDLSGQNCCALIGRDFLSGAVLVYNGPGGFYSISF